jgi:hypothetical protein
LGGGVAEDGAMGIVVGGMELYAGPVALGRRTI